MIPLPRKENLVIQESRNELLVYDMDTNRAICLNETSAMIWQKCDGVKSPWEIGKEMEKELKAPISEDLVWFALEQLHKEKLLANDEDFTSRYKRLNRREVIRRLGLASVVSLPIVSSLVAPLALNAQSAVCVAVMNGCQCDMPGRTGGRGNPCTTSGLGTPGVPCANPACTCVHANGGNNYHGNCV